MSEKPEARTKDSKKIAEESISKTTGDAGDYVEAAGSSEAKGTTS